MELRLIAEGEQAGQKLKKNMEKAGHMVREAMRGAAKDAAEQIKTRGVDDIAAGGNFGSRWQSALHSDTEETQRTIRVITSMQGGPPVSYWRVFEYGATIAPKTANYLWLPFQGSEGTHVWPRDYSGELSFFKTPSGLPILKDKATNIFMYHGHLSVTIGQKFHLRKIIAEVSRELKQFYAEHMKG